MANPKRSLKICCGMAVISLIMHALILIVLGLTIFRPRQPEILAQPVSLEKIEIKGFPNAKLNVTLLVVVTVKNRNYGGFKFKNSTSYVNYRGGVVAEVPIREGSAPARSKINFTTSVEVMADKLITDPHFWGDVLAGRLNMTATAALQGKVSTLKIFKFKAKAFSSCDISIVIATQDIESHCQSKIKL